MIKILEVERNAMQHRVRGRQSRFDAEVLVLLSLPSCHDIDQLICLGMGLFALVSTVLSTYV